MNQEGYGNTIEPTKQKYPDTYQYSDPMVDKIKRLILKFGHTALIVNRLDYYGNGIPIGAFCNAFCFILCGFYRCKVYDDKDSFLLSIVLFFGGIGQITAGLMEFMKGRAFTSSLYFFLGFSCLSSFGFRFLDGKTQDKIFHILFLNESESRSAFFGACMIIIIPFLISSFKTNAFYVGQTVVTFIFFLLACIGESVEKDGARRIAAGILEIIAGFISLYIFSSQLLNEQFRTELLPAFPLVDDNEIDITKENTTPAEY